MSVNRALVALLAIAFSVPAFAGDVDTHFDRARGREERKVIRTGPPNEPRMEVAQETTPPTPTKDGAVALSATPKPCTCTVDTRAK